MNQQQIDASASFQASLIFDAFTRAYPSGAPIDIESLQNRLLKICYVPATSDGLPRVSFFFSFLFLVLRPITVVMKQTRQVVCAVFIDVYGSTSQAGLTRKY
jgi:hypothetical protein